jgi:hypothetical protein
VELNDVTASKSEVSLVIAEKKSGAARYVTRLWVRMARSLRKYRGRNRRIDSGETKNTCVRQFWIPTVIAPGPNPYFWMIEKYILRCEQLTREVKGSREMESISSALSRRDFLRRDLTDDNFVLAAMYTSFKKSYVAAVLTGKPNYMAPSSRVHCSTKYHSYQGIGRDLQVSTQKRRSSSILGNDRQVRRSVGWKDNAIFVFVRPLITFRKRAAEAPGMNSPS